MHDTQKILRGSNGRNWKSAKKYWDKDKGRLKGTKRYEVFGEEEKYVYVELWGDCSIVRRTFGVKVCTQILWYIYGCACAADMFVRP